MFCSQGFATSSMADVYAHWSPMSERARLVSFAAIGKTVSPIVNYPASGFLAFTFGWAGMFYISGGSQYYIELQTVFDRFCSF